MTLFLIQVANGSLALGRVGLGVDGSMIDVLVSDRLARKSKTLPELCRVETLRTVGNSGGNSSW